MSPRPANDRTVGGREAHAKVQRNRGDGPLFLSVETPRLDDQCLRQLGHVTPLAPPQPVGIGIPRSLLPPGPARRPPQITTDAEGRVTFLNRVAEALTGWFTADAAGRPLPDVFQIVNEQTRRSVDNPALRALARWDGGWAGEPHGPHRPGRTAAPVDDSAADA